MERQKRSWVWNYFSLSEQSDSKVVCAMCKRELIYSNSTGCMLNHLKRHPQVSRTSTTQQGTQKLLNDIDVFTTRRNLAGKAKQRCLPDKVARRCPQSKTEQITNAIADMITVDLLPISMVTGYGFKKFMMTSQPGYLVPGRKQITSLLERRYRECAERIKVQLQAVNTVAISMDGSTSLPTDGYITVTCHYISNWTMKSVLLQTLSYNEQHTGLNLSQLLKSVVAEWNLTGKVIACILDNVSNTVLANSRQYLPWESVLCFVHTLQLAINDGMTLPEVDEVVVACNKLVSHFHHNAFATQCLQTKQTFLNVTRRRLIQSCRTCWNSVCNMFERLLEQQQAVAAVLADRKVTTSTEEREFALQESHWQVIQDLLPILKALKCATTALGTQSNVSISIIFPVTNALLTIHLVVSEDDTQVVAAFKNAASESLKQRVMDNLEMGEIGLPLIAAWLDPRHKQMKFLSPTRYFQIHEHLMEILHQLLEQVSTITNTTMSDIDKMSSDGVQVYQDLENFAPRRDHVYSAKQPRMDISAMQLLLGTEYSKAPVVTENQTELEKYWSEPNTALDIDALAWWRVNEDRFPKLCKLALKYLCVPATSVPADRVFSVTGLVVNKQRSQLSAEHINMLVFLRKNFHEHDAYDDETDEDDNNITNTC